MNDSTEANTWLRDGLDAAFRRRAGLAPADEDAEEADQFVPPGDYDGGAGQPMPPPGPSMSALLRAHRRVRDDLVGDIVSSDPDRYGAA